MSNDHNDLTTEEQNWANRAGHALRASEAQLDAVTVARLRAARARAMDRAAASWSAPDLRPLSGIGAGAALAVAVLAWTLLPRTTPTPETEPAVNLAGMDALELLTDEQGPEFYEDLDLYLWLEEESGDRA